MNIYRKTLVIVGVATVMIFASTGTALAAEAGSEFDIYGGRGGALWDWDTRYKIINLRTVAWDQMCNAAFLCRDKDGGDECVGNYYANPLP